MQFITLVWVNQKDFNYVMCMTHKVIEKSQARNCYRFISTILLVHGDLKSVFSV
jgi:hypothetical protein